VYRSLQGLKCIRIQSKADRAAPFILALILLSGGGVPSRAALEGRGKGAWPRAFTAVLTQSRSGRGGRGGGERDGWRARKPLTAQLSAH
jgi:hypothetical protein